MLGVETGAGNDGGGEPFVLVIGGLNEATFRALEGVFAGSELREFKVAVFGSDDEAGVLAIGDFEDRDPGAGQRVASDCVNYGTGDAVTRLRCGDGGVE